MRAQTILFLSVDGVKEKLDCRPYRGGGEGQSQETTRGCKPRLFKPIEFLDLTGSTGTWMVSGVFQSTPARGGRPIAADVDAHRRHVSIHARARRATVSQSLYQIRSGVSIHARARRATRYVGVDSWPEWVSIHARARRATRYVGVDSWPEWVSIHARARRATFDGFTTLSNVDVFQSTPARGGRQRQC